MAGIDDPVQHWQITQRLTPSFTSERYGDPGYAQLSITCADELRSGAEEGGEIGAFHLLHQSQRALNLRSVIDEFLPAGAEAGIFYLT